MRPEAERALLVEDSRFFGALVRRRLIVEAELEVTWVETHAAAAAAIAAAARPFDVAICNLALPDVTDGQGADCALSAGIPTIVLSGSLNDTTRDAVWAKGVFDYVLKEGPHAIDQLVELVSRVLANHEVEVLVVDGSPVGRAQLVQLLETQRYTVHPAADGAAALALLAAHPTIKLAVIDQHLPEMDGLALVKELRRSRDREQLSIIGLCPTGDLSARLIKSGANDLLHRPFVAEELYCRVTENLRALEQVQRLESMATRDYLTGLHNRRYLFLAGEKLFANGQRKHFHVGAAMVDIDHLERTNATYGQQAGDEVLKAVARVLAGRFRTSDVVARVGGEEFAVLTAAMDPNEAPRIFDEVRARVEALEIPHGDELLRTSVSVGVCMSAAESLPTLLQAADKLLHQAKESGRNRVVFDGVD